MKKVECIDSFRGKHFFLSNYYIAPLMYGGVSYTNSEAAFHAQKCPSRALEFSELAPNVAKKLGRQVKLCPDWEKTKYSIMYHICLEKFNQNPELKELLVKTGRAELIEGNTWGDTYWGVCNGKGENNLGIILMDIRAEFELERKLDKHKVKFFD